MPHTLRLVVEESVNHVEKPGVVLVRAQCCKPHLPVQTRLVGGCGRKGCFWGAGGGQEGCLMGKGVLEVA